MDQTEVRIDTLLSSRPTEKNAVKSTSILSAQTLKLSNKIVLNFYSCFYLCPLECPVQ